MMIREAKDQFMASNIQITFKYWIEILIEKLKTAIEIARIPMKLKLGKELDNIDKKMLVKYK